MLATQLVQYVAHPKTALVLQSSAGNQAKKYAYSTKVTI